MQTVRPVNNTTSRDGARVWLVLGDKMGDNGQVYTIRDALNWPVEIKHIKMLAQYVFGKPKVGPTLYHIDREASDALQPPWPDLIITVGRRPANVALWIREQSGGRTRIVLVGKPSGMMQQFDLITAFRRCPTCCRSRCPSCRWTKPRWRTPLPNGGSRWRNTRAR